MFRRGSLLYLALASGALAQTYSATYLPSNAPNQTEEGQSGTNQCGTGNDQNSMCQNIYGASLSPLHRLHCAQFLSSQRN